jgi:hypothetical protein
MAIHYFVPDQGVVMIDRSDGRGQQPATRVEIVGLAPGQESPHSDGFRRFAMGLVVTAGAAVIGRAVFRLRL